MSRSQLSVVGGFVVAGVLLFAVGIFMIGDRRLLFTEHFEVRADFGQVTGIQVGTQVRVGGLDAGEVLGLDIPASPTERFVVTMRVREDLRPLVRTDSIAAPLTDGLLGNVFIQIREGTSSAALVEPGGSIRGVDAIEIADLISEGRETFRVLSNEFLQLRADFGSTIAMLGETVETTTLLMNDVGNDVRVLSSTSALFMDEVRAVTADTRQMFTRIRAGEGTIGRLLTDDTLYEQATRAAADLEATLEAARETSEHAAAILADFREPDGPRDAIWSDLQAVLATAQNAMTDLSENTEALKRNWLFRGFFDDRGFFNLDAMTLAEYEELGRRGDYETLRTWVEADRLFEIGPDGRERLTDQGRARIDTVMSDFLRYPRNSPLVVEGYATAGDRADQYLQSDQRSALVRDYLVSTFGRVATLTGTMPVGAGAVDSPRGDGRWDGVALALFVRPDDFQLVTTAGG